MRLTRQKYIWDSFRGLGMINYQVGGDVEEPGKFSL
jgi:hypothetical protein